MRLVVQRVGSASVAVDGEVISSIDLGLLVLAGVGKGDTTAGARKMAARVAQLRIFPDDEGRMNRSVRDVRGEVLVVSQFTLYADTRKGHRPSFLDAAPPEEAGPVIDSLVAGFALMGIAARQGKFQAHMLVSLTNDGPVTIVMEG